MALLNSKIQNFHYLNSISTGAYIPMYLETKNYVLQTVDNRADYLASLKLRRNVFAEDFGVNFSHREMEWDKYDYVADTIVIKERQQGKVIGCYRMIGCQFSRSFYTQSEFNIENFSRLPGRKVELSRACVHPKHRNGLVIMLLWKGLHQYLTHSGARYLFGCSSIPLSPNYDLTDLENYFAANGYLTSKYKVNALEDYSPASCRKSFEAPDNTNRYVDSKEFDRVAPLLKLYLKAGAVICTGPALDMEFHCFDFFTVLDTKRLNESFNKKFKH